MPDQTSKPHDEAAILALRQTLADAYTFVLSVELTRGVASMNLEHMMQQELARLRGPKNSEIYLPVLDRLKALKASVNDAVEAIKEIPPERFKLKVEGTGTNQDAEPA